MRRYGLLGAAVCLSTMAHAETKVVDCDAVFETFKAQNDYDLSQCKPDAPVYTLDECEKPDSFVPGAPVTHVILALDASGSMAGKSGGKTKMEIAKQEALAFLTELHRTTKVSLVVYGHSGDNTEAGKSASCAQAETLHSFKASKRQLAESIGALGPVGWTPLAGALTHVRAEIAQLAPETRGAKTAPVVYMISDGEETCGGDPVAAAKALAEDGIRTTINTIGFDADPKTRAQLEAIADVGGGTFYAADSAKALRKKLRDITDARNKIHRYNYCVNLNMAVISGTYQRITSKLMQCYQKNDPHKFVTLALQAGKTAAPGSDIAKCERELFDAARAYAAKDRGWLQEVVTPSVKLAVTETEAYQARMGVIDPPD